MNLRALKTLCEIERLGSFAAVAERLGLTISAVSLQMKTLEEALQLDLFDRSHRPPTLTPAGRRAAAHARRMLVEADAIRAIDASDGALHGDYRIGFVATASVRLMPGFLARVRREAPRARVDVEIGLSAALLDRVSAGLLDAAVVTRTASVAPDLTFETIRAEAIALARPPAAAGASLQACAARYPLIQFSPDTGIGVLAARHLRAQNVEAQETIVLDAVEAVMGCVNAGVGFALLPEPDVARYAGPGVTLAPQSGTDGAPLTRELALAAPRVGGAAGQTEMLADLLRGAPAPPPVGEPPSAPRPAEAGPSGGA